MCFICSLTWFLSNSWDREAIQLVQTLTPKETGWLTAAAHYQPQNESLINCYSRLPCPINKLLKRSIEVDI